MSTTGLLARTLAALAGKPALFVSASAVGIYGADRGDLFLDEKSSLGSDFLAQLCQDWEAATEPARAAGIRVIHSRTGIVLHPDGSVLAKLMPVFRMGVGGKAGSGDQWTSWIARTDLIRAITFLVESSDAPEGPFNLVAPTPVTNAELSKTLGHVLRRPAVAPVPAAVLRLALGREMADLTVLASQKVHPTRLLEAGFEFQLPELEAALRREIGA
jgi:uncharacterized protein (TIGR01777 family)